MRQACRGHFLHSASATFASFSGDSKYLDCDMSLQTQTIISDVNSWTLKPDVRNHQIAIYPETHLQ
jgi:hypothetical protein